MISANPNGVREAVRSLVRILLLALAVMVAVSALSLYLLKSIPLADCATIAAKIALPFLPVVAFAYLAGCLEPGSMERLEVRLCTAAYLIACLLLVVHNSDLALYGAGASLPGLQISRLDVSVKFTAICYIMLLIPACTLADATIEYIGTRPEN